MKDYIEERAVEIAYYIIEHKATVRQTAKEFGVSKSTIHKDCTDRLEQINPTLAQSVRKVLDVNKQERHIRGGRTCVRTALYMATISAIRCNTAIRDFNQRLRNAGKPAKVAIVACMHKLLRVLHAVAHSKAPWRAT